MNQKNKMIGKAAILGTLLIFCFTTFSIGQPDEIDLDNREAYKNKQRTSVNFMHENHMGSFECLDCHHRYENNENVLEEDEIEEGADKIACSSCHDDEAGIDLKKAYHRQCMGCHIDVRKQGNPSGPELCGECHPKK